LLNSIKEELINVRKQNMHFIFTGMSTEIGGVSTAVGVVVVVGNIF
jgi:hypothetical protein